MRELVLFAALLGPLLKQQEGNVAFVVPSGCDDCWGLVRSAVRHQFASHLRLIFYDGLPANISIPYGAQRVTIFLFYDDSDRTVEWMESSKSMGYSFTWIILASGAVKGGLQERFKNIPACLDSEVTAVIGDTFYEMYRVLKRNPLLVQKVDRVKKKQSAEVNRMNFHGAILNVTAVEHKDYAYDVAFERRDGQVYFQSGFSVELLFALQTVMNFSVRAIPTETWGHSENGMWKGSMLKVMEGDADLAISSTAHVTVRQHVVDFNFPTNFYWVSAYFKRPTSSSLHDIFLSPFTPWLWLALTSLMAFMVLNMYFIGEIHRKVFGDGGSLFTSADALLWSVATLSQKSYHHEPHSCSERAVFLVGFMMGVLLYTGYSAVLVSHLSVRVEPIRNLDELRKSGMSIAFVNYPITNDLFSDPFYPDKSVRLLYKARSVRSRDTFSELEVVNAIRQVHHRPLAYVAGEIPVRLAILSLFRAAQTCQFQELHLPHTRKAEGTYVQKGSPIRRTIDLGILRLVEKGLVSRWRQRWVVAMPPCAKPSPYNQAQVQELFSAFLLLAAMSIMSLAILAIERIVGRFQAHQPEEWRYLR